MKPNMIGLNHTGFGGASFEAASSRTLRCTSLDFALAMREVYSASAGQAPALRTIASVPELTSGEPPTRRARREASRPRRGGVVSTAIGVLGELLLTAGVGVLLFLGWQLWLNNAVVAEQQSGLAREVGAAWQRPTATAPGPAPTATPAPPPTVQPFAGPPPAFEASLVNAEVFARLIVPRFGADYVRPIAEGVDTEDVLDRLGVGHYPETALPGAPGNFALAAHRTAYGSSFEHIDELDVGDSIYVETQAGWYRYVFRNHEMVTPSAVEVLLPVPRAAGASPAERFITLTSCNPKFSTLERIIAYGVFDAWYPREAGAPPEIAHLIEAVA